MIFTAIGRDHHGNLFILFQPIFLCCHQQYHLLTSHKERIPKEVCNPHWVAEPSAGKTFFPSENPFSLWFLSLPGVKSPVKDKALLPFCIAPPARVLDFNFRKKNRYEQENLLCYCHLFPLSTYLLAKKTAVLTHICPWASSPWKLWNETFWKSPTKQSSTWIFFAGN